MMEFFMPMDPPTATAQEKQVMVRDGKPVFYSPDQVKAAKQKLLAHLAKHKPEKPYTCGLRLEVLWCFAPHNKNQLPGTYRTIRPDTDNLQKMLKDCMTECGFWKDDALVASELVEKFWSDVPGIWIRIRQLQENSNAD